MAGNQFTNLRTQQDNPGSAILLGLSPTDGTLYGLQTINGAPDAAGNRTAQLLVATRRFVTVLAVAGTASYTASATTPDLAADGYSELKVDFNITALSGTSPSITIGVDAKGADGIYYNLWTSPAKTAAAAVSVNIGAGMEVAKGFGSLVRVTWTITGTSPSITMTYSVTAK